MGALNGWHRGERLVRKKTGYDKHSTFYTTRLPFLPVTTLSEDGRPWSSILAGKHGELGFVHHPKHNTLSIDAKLWPGEPLLRNASVTHGLNGPTLIAGIGVEVSTRRRNKFAGHVAKLEVVGERAHIELSVNEAIGNCPKYIVLRELVPHVNSHPLVLNDTPQLPVGERLSEEAISLVLHSDTLFFGTTYIARNEDAKLYPSHLGMNHRGGRPGFVRVRPSDGRTLVLPDFSGNRIMTSLGNIEATPLASLTFIDFQTGDILYITGNARNVFGDDARSIMPFQDTLTEIFVTGYTYVRDALPVRERLGNVIQPSPYTPPLRLLAEEDPQSTVFSARDQLKALLTRLIPHSPTLATFEFETSSPVQIQPGQAAIMDFRALLGSRRYQHMSPMKPSLVNDDFIRTWTVSSASLDLRGTNSFSLTMREKDGGIVTGALFSIMRKLEEVRPDTLEDCRDLQLSVNLVGIAGDFVLQERTTTTRQLLWIAGGIGVTPFLSMLAALAQSRDEPLWDITLMLSTREPDIMLSLLSTALGESKIASKLTLHVFTNSVDAIQTEVQFTKHTGRVDEFISGEMKPFFGRSDTEIYLCGPEPFEKAVRDSLAIAGVDVNNVHQEGFAY